MKNPLINYQNCVSSNSIDGEKPLSQVLDLIKNGSTLTNKLIDEARRRGKGTTEYDEIKKNHLPAFLFNFTFDKKLAIGNIIHPTGLLYLDIDDIKSDCQLSFITEEVKHIPYALACWKSLSERGLSILISVKGLTLDNFQLFKAYFNHWYKYNEDGNSGLNLDVNAWKPTQKTVLSRDEELYVNWECDTLTYRNVISYGFARRLILDSRKVQSTLLKEGKEEVGGYTAPLANVGIKSKSTHQYLTLTDRFKHAHKDKEFTVYESGVSVTKIFLNKKNKIKQGSRHTALFAIACKYILMNGESFTYTLNFLKLVRSEYCENPKSITNSELNKIVKKALKNYTSAKIKKDLAKVIFPKDSLLSVKEKLTIVGREMGKIKTANTIKLLQSKYKQGMTQKELVKAAKKSLRTVKTYWNIDKNGNVYFARPSPRKGNQCQ
jgi:hypothetical protein